MKKMIRLGLCMGLLSAALTCTALAADDEYTTNIDGTVTYDGGSYSASYTGTQKDNQYVLLVVKGTVDSEGAAHYSVTEDTIVYIDQQPATAAGVSFENWIPMSTPDCVVLLGGEFGDGRSPKVLGTLIGKGTTIEVPKANVSYVGTTAPTMTISNGSNQFNFTVGSDGSYTASGVPDGQYTFTIAKKSHLTFTTTITIENGVIVGGVPTVELLAGDVDGDDGITLSDLTEILRNYGKSGDEITADIQSVDFDENGGITLTELSIVLSNYGM